VNLFAPYALLPSGLTTIRATPLPAPTLAGDNAESAPAPPDASASDPLLKPVKRAASRAAARVAVLGQPGKEGSVSLLSRPGFLSNISRASVTDEDA